MAKNILFITDISNSFFLNTIISTMEKSGFECDCVEYEPSAIGGIKKELSAYFLFLGQSASTRNYTTLMYIKNICDEKKKRVFLLGESKDVKEVTDILDPSIVWEAYTRPINAGDVAKQIIKIFDDISANDKRREILLVDDSGTVLHTMKSWLEPYYKVTMVNSASNGLVYLGKHRPHLILLDYEMPVCDGPQMLGMIRSDPVLASIPVMFLTSKGDRESLEKVLALQPQGYLLKSLPKEKILESLSNFFAGKTV